MYTYKYLVLADLDGTLLNGNGELSGETIKYVHKLNERDDILFAFSTGRPWPQCKKIYEKLELKGFVSCCNSAFIFNPHTKQSVYSFVNKKIAKSLLTSQLMVDALDNGSLYTEKAIFTFNKHNTLEVLNNLEACKADVFSIKLFYDRKAMNINAKIQFVKSFDPQASVTIYEEKEFINIEVQAGYADKAVAIKFFSNYYGVKEFNVLVFGDSYNDIPALKSGARSYAVNNAIIQIKQNAKFISNYTNNQDSVIKEVEAFLKEKKQ